MNWITAARQSGCGMAFRREQTSLFFVHPELGQHYGLFPDDYFVKMRFRESLLKDDWEPLNIASEPGLRFVRALIGGVIDLVEE